MTRYVVTARSAQFGPGAVLELSEAQAKARAHCLRAAGPNQFEPTALVEFKCGEEFGVVSGDIAKATLAEIAPAGSEEAPAARTRAAKGRGAA